MDFKEYLKNALDGLKDKNEIFGSDDQLKDKDDADKKGANNAGSIAFLQLKRKSALNDLDYDYAAFLEEKIQKLKENKDV